MICCNTPPKGKGKADGTLSELSISVLYKKNEDGSWDYYKTIGNTFTDKIVTEWLRNDGTLKKFKDTLDIIKTQEALSAHMASIYFYMDFDTKETNLTISFPNQLMVDIMEREAEHGR